MCNVQEAQRRLAAENQARLFYFISHHVFQMNKLLKCSICFDVYEKPTTVFHCFHVFCEDCIKTYLDFAIAKEPPCPICQKPILRNDLCPNNVLEKIVEFVKFAQERTKCDVSKPPAFKTVLSNIKNNNGELSMENEGAEASNIPPPDYSLILNARKILIGLNSQIISTVEKLPHDLPSVSFRDGSLKTPASTKRNSGAIQSSVNRSKDSFSNNKDLFDVVKAAPILNPFFKRSKLVDTKTYAVQKQPKNENRNDAFADKILQFKDDSNKIKIIEWLNDNCNKFDAVPLTQERNVPDSQIVFDMPSVSQRHKQKINPVHVPQLSQINKQKLEQIKIREKSELVTHLSRIDCSAKTTQCRKNNRLTRSLEHCTKTRKHNPKLKRHSISVAEKITIEQFNSEDEIIFNENMIHTTSIVNVLEEKCLNSIEAEVLQSRSKIPAHETKNAEAPKSTKRIPVRSSKLLQVTEETKKLSNKKSSGWTRMKEIKKTIKKVEKQPKKLMISGVSRCSSTITSAVKGAEGSSRTCIETTKMGKAKRKDGEAVVILERMDIDAFKSKTNAYDLDVMESYFSKQLEKMEVLQKDVENTKNEIGPGSNCTVGSSASKKELHSGNVKSNSINKLLVSAIIHNTNKGESKHNSSKIESLAIEEEDFKSNSEKPKNNLKPLKKADDATSTSISFTKIGKGKLKLLANAGPSNLDQIMTVPNNSVPSTSNQKSEYGKSKKNSKPFKDVINEVPTPASSDKNEKEKLQLGKGELEASLDRITKLDNLSTSSVPKSRKRLFDDQKSEPIINKTVKKTDKSLLNHELNDDELNQKESDKLLPSSTIHNFVKQKSNLTTLSLEEKSKLDMQKFAEQVIMQMSKQQSNNSITGLDSNSMSNRIDDFGDDFFMLPTQVILGKESKKQAEIIADDDDDEIFKIATQVIAIKETHKYNNCAQQEKSLENVLKAKIQSLHNLLSTPNFVSKMKTVLHDIEKTISTEESLCQSTRNKLISDVQIQTDFKEGSFFSHDATTQTVFPEEKLKHAAIQTDSHDSSRGFRISSTDMFQTRPLMHTEMQTDIMACPQCSYVFGSSSNIAFLNNPTAISSDALLRDSNIIRSLSEKYVLSESFDHIDFETQDVIKGKGINGSSTLLKDVTKSKNETNKENQAQNIIKIKKKESGTSLNDSGLFQRPKLTPSVNLTAHKFCKTPNKKPYKRIRKPSSGSDSDDGLPKNVKKNKFIQDDLSLHFASESQKETQVKETEEGNGFLLSGGSEDIDYGEYLQSVLKKCDEELMTKKSPSCKMAGDVMSLEPSPKRSKTQDIIEECKLILQEACSGAITIENTEKLSDARQDIQKPTKLTLTALEEEFRHNFSNDDDGKGMMELDVAGNENPCSKFENDIAKNEDVKMKSENRNKFSESLFSSTGNFSKSFDNLPNSHLKVHNLDVKNNVVKEIVKNAAEKLATQSSLDELVDALEEFDNSFGENVNIEEKSSRQNNNITIEVGKKIPTEVPENVNKSNGRVKILQNVVIVKNNTTDQQSVTVMENTTAEAKSEAEPVDKHNESDDMFLSDADVVETTPQKNKPVSLEKISLLSQTYYNPEEKIILPPVAGESPDIISSLDPPPLTCLGEVFIPPPEFQDTPNEEPVVDNVQMNLNRVENDHQHSVIDLVHSQDVNEINLISAPSLSSLTPDLLLPQIGQANCNKKKPFVTSTQYSENSQILPSKSLNLSPIGLTKFSKEVNPILAAQAAKFSPLNFVKSKTPPPQRYPILATSTPKQKSILNYVRSNENANMSFTKSEYGSQSSQKSATELTPVNKKPYVACTRMSKEQLFAITSLSNRKLISYSNTFTSGVTHMIVDVNQQNRVKDHTMKFVSAVAAGIWVLNFTWVEECLKQNHLLPEERFEALDMSGVAGPQRSRLTRFTNPLLKGFKIHAAPSFKSTTQKEVENVVKFLGGEVVPRLDDLIPSNGKICLIITEAKESEDFDMYEMWLDMLKIVTVDLEWLSRSVGQYQRLSLKPFILCSEESICDLGYPAELLTDVPFSHTL